jgi:uncharacterized iron-regulated membrane protein
VAKDGKRSGWWRVHSWIGLKLGIVLTFILATGTLATVSNEIDWLLTPAMHARSEAGRPIPWDGLLASAAGHARGGTVEMLTAPVERGFAAQALVILPSGEARRLWFDPADGRFQGETGWRNVQQVLRQLHRRMTLPNGPGYFLVSLFSLLLAMSLVTGLVSYKRFWRGFFRVPRYRRGQVRKYVGDLHRFAALWTLWFVTIMAMTGMIYLVQAVGIEPRPTPTPIARSASPPVQTTLGQCLALLRTRVAGIDIRMIFLPARPGEPILAVGQGAAFLTEDGGNRVEIDPVGCTPTSRIDATALDATSRIFLAANPLHFGHFGGLATKLLWFLCGCLLTGLAVTGTIIYAQRMARECPVGALSRWRAGLGRWLYPTTSLVSAGLLLTIGALAGPLSFALDDWQLW